MLSPENIHTGGILWPEKVIVRDTNVYTKYIYRHTTPVMTINKKQTMNLKERDRKEGHMGGFRGRKGMDKNVVIKL